MVRAVAMLAVVLGLAGCESNPTPRSSSPVEAQPTEVSPSVGYAVLTDSEQIRELCDAVKPLNGLIDSDRCFTESDDALWTHSQSIAADAVTRFIARCRASP